MKIFTSSKETSTIRCTKCGGLMYGELQHTGDKYCKGHETKQLNITDMIDWTKVSDNEKVIELIKQREEIEKQIREIDNMALVRYEIEALQE